MNGADVGFWALARRRVWRKRGGWVLFGTGVGVWVGEERLRRM